MLCYGGRCHGVYLLGAGATLLQCTKSAPPSTPVAVTRVTTPGDLRHTSIGDSRSECRWGGQKNTDHTGSSLGFTFSFPELFKTRGHSSHNWRTVPRITNSVGRMR